MIIFAMKMDENIRPFYFDQGEGGRDKGGCLIASPSQKKKKSSIYIYIHGW